MKTRILFVVLVLIISTMCVSSCGGQEELIQQLETEIRVVATTPVSDFAGDSIYFIKPSEFQYSGTIWPSDSLIEAGRRESGYSLEYFQNFGIILIQADRIVWFKDINAVLFSGVVEIEKSIQPSDWFVMDKTEKINNWAEDHRYQLSNKVLSLQSKNQPEVHGGVTYRINFLVVQRDGKNETYRQGEIYNGGKWERVMLP